MKKQNDYEIQRYKDEINNLKKITKNLANNNEQIYDKKRRELDERENMIKQKENEINNKISFLEDKENLIEKENKEIDIKRKQLEKEIEENKRMIQNSKKKNSSKNPLERYRIPPLIGLNNIGATCFMNSTLQCLSQTKELTNYFLNVKNENKIINNNIASVNKKAIQLSPVYLELIKKLWDEKGEKSFSPYNFMNIVEKMNPLFKQGQAGDSKDFIIFILEQLHKELKKSVNNNGLNNNLVLNQYDKNNAFNFFFNDFKKECSIISDIFFGFTETTNECLYYKKVYYSKEYNNAIKNNRIQINNNCVSIIEYFYHN
jgi:ubiquitin C-terminal hydrolase